ncbi:MAG: Isoleucyl-tRNA synthetase [Candidatus Roizmanbacteria bacterium GW2011_GWC2_34_23]|uniref:Isoleucine--tRNA ligase n=2 Tax=Candidatus Roizmaniibacteriota TaxID=1752723 RepID=A0A0G0AWT0_9BACT|nr:MAG: Isoleucyl-tRNA synthetase [Candidatus Roizmanbacteria bacterium GW2011_GWC2_34_23]
MFKPVESNQNFPEMEKKWLKHWYEKGIVKKYLDKNKNSKKYFSFLDGPITANNPMGVHHAWGRTYKDLWPRFYNLLGYKQRFQNGFDCQGLWVEVEVEKELGLHSKKDIENLVPGDTKASVAKFVQLCKDRVKKYSGIQTEQSKRLGYFADWEHSYFTMSDENNYMIWNFLKKCFDHGWIYKGHESVPWCPRCETAISQHEMLTEDYKELVHESVILKLRIVETRHASSVQKNKNEYLLVWTTTPWTIPANIAVAVDKKADYCLVQGLVSKDSFFWVMKDLVEKVFTEGYGKIIKTVKGKELIGLKYSSPFDSLPIVKEIAKNNFDTFHTVIPTDDQIMPISATEGTGLVHTAVSAGTEDFMLGKKLGLPMIPVIADNADYLPGLGFLSGQNAKKHPEIILDFLREEDKKGNDCVFNIFRYKHRYPACWRCKTELVWKVEDEWYVAMDRPSQLKIKNEELRINKTLRERMVEVAKKIKWMPEFGLDRELDWLKNMHDWLISKKNRYWGLALPIYECECGEFEVIGSKEDLKKRAISGWKEFEGHTPHKPYIDEVKIKCQKCGRPLSRINDVGNPWLDAGIVAFSTIREGNQGEPLYNKDKNEWRKWFPANFITESFPGQFKNWFYALIAESTVLEDEAPFERVLGFGTQFGEDGRPMHKSWGNAIEFNEGADKIGVDVMRWMFARHNPADNMLFGYKKADEVRRQFYLMLWNIYKFFVEYANLDKFNVETRHASSLPESKNVLDKWILSRFVSLVITVEKNLKEFSAKDAALEIEKFVSDLSTWYIRRSRDRVWVNSDNKIDKNNFYETLYYILVNLSIIISPFIPFVAEEIYTNLTGGESVNLENWPTINLESKIKNSELENEMSLARKIVEAGQAERKLTGIKVRIPLANLQVKTELTSNFKSISSEVWNVVLKELNIKNITINKNFHYPEKEIKVTDEQLEKEGKLRELIREIQSQRKLKSLKTDEKINLTIPREFEKEEDFIAKRVLAKKISFGDKVEVQ